MVLRNPSDVLPAWIKQKRETGSIVELYYVLMQELHLSHNDINEMPIPAILSLTDKINEIKKKQEKEHKKAMRSAR